MTSVLIRTGSEPALFFPIHDSQKYSYSYHDSAIGILFSDKNQSSSPRSSLHLEIKNKKNLPKYIRRAFSETDMIQSVYKVSNRFSKTGSRSFPSRIPEVDEEDLLEENSGRSVVLKKKSLDRCSFDRSSGILPENEVLPEEIEFSGGGIGKGRKIGGGGDGGDSGGSLGSDGADQSKIGAYYEEMLKSDPQNPLLLRNYGKFLHEVERDVVRAEQYYERAILASPGDGEVLSLYGNLIWDTHRDGERAKSYLDQAVQASPDDCYVLGSYAHFLWDAEEEDEDESQQVKAASTTAPLVQVF